MASTPYQTTSALTTVVAPGAIVGQSQTDTVSFFGGTGITGGNAALTNLNLTGLTAGQTGCAIVNLGRGDICGRCGDRRAITSRRIHT